MAFWFQVYCQVCCRDSANHCEWFIRRKATEPCLASYAICSPTEFLHTHLSLSDLTTLGLVCQLVDICLLPPPSVVMVATPPPHPLPPPHPSCPAFSALLSCPPPLRHQLWTTYAYPAAQLIQPCDKGSQHCTAFEMGNVLCCRFADPEISYPNKHTEIRYVSK